MKHLGLALAITTALLAAGCTNMTPEQQGTTSGAAIGALAGAGIAAIAGGSGWTGAAVGAVAGGVAGNIKANRQQQQ
jgi:uncharacterized protein YcfJ